MTHDNLKRQSIELTDQEIDTLIEACCDAQAELCIDTTGSGRYPEATAYYARLDEIMDRLITLKRIGS